MSGDVLDVDVDMVGKVPSLAVFMTKLRNLITMIENNKGTLNGRIINGVKDAQT